MEVWILASGSSGNATLVRSGGTSLLIDAGLSALAVRRRLEAAGTRVDAVSALLLTHEHSDHVRGVRVLVKRHPLPVWATAGTWSALELRTGGGGELVSGRPVRFGPLRVHPVATSHDAAEPVALVVEDGDVRVGLCTDTGVMTALLMERLAGCDCLLLEANHDADMLRHGPYPWVLKQRIASRQGHLANHQTAEALHRLAGPTLQAAVGMHLSAENNTPGEVERALRAAVNGAATVVAAPRAGILRLDLGRGRAAIEVLPSPPPRRRAVRG